MLDKLKKCPFCEEDNQDNLCLQYNGSGQQWIQCICGASGPTAKTAETAAWYWNRNYIKNLVRDGIIK